MKTVANWCLVFLALMAHLLAAPGEVPATAARPNIVFILADDLGYGDLGVYGAPDIRTPNIDRLAARGVKLTQAYANAAVCTPTRTAFMTGRYQQRVGGLETAIHPGRVHLGLPSSEPTLPRLLGAAGYTTLMSGKWHLGYVPEFYPRAHGFDRFFGLLSGNHDYFTHRENNGNADLFLEDSPVERDGYSTDLITRHALKFIEERPKDRPFFLYLPHNSPHFPYQTPADARKVGSNFQDGDRATYAGMVEALDAAVGAILDYLAKNDLEQNTLVIFTSDNGGDKFARNEPFSGKKTTYAEGGIRVPVIASWPGRLPAGVTCDQVAITMDWTATFLGLAGAEAAANRPLDGMDLWPVLSGKTAPVPRSLFWRNRTPRGALLDRVVRDGDWKLVRSATGETKLYQLLADPGEQLNLAAAEPARVERMSRLIDAWEREVDPPLYRRELDQMKGYPAPAKKD